MMAIKKQTQIKEELMQAIDNITSNNAQKRWDGWHDIHERSAEYRGILSSAQMVFLRNAMLIENDPMVYRMALNALLALAMATPNRISKFGGPLSFVNDPELETMEQPVLLPYWILDPFRGPSAVLAVTATNFCRRDESALLWLSRRLSFMEFPNTDYWPIHLENPDVNRVLFSDKYHAFLIVGRLGLFGTTALERLGHNELRFGFDVPRRPKGLPPGELDPKYHCVFEQTGKGRRKYYRTVEKDNIRTDFVVVQRYQVNLGGTRNVVVVIIAGASSLGTTAGAQWVAYNLFQPTDAIDKGPIEVPKRINPHSRLEALLCARAKVTTSVWENPEIDLIKLYADGAWWSVKDQKWHEAPVQLITIVYENSQPVEVLFDNEPSRLDPGKQIFRLMVALGEQVVNQGNPEIAISELAADGRIWEKPDPTVDYVRTQLRLLRHRYLQDALYMQKTKTILLRAQVKILNKP